MIHWELDMLYESYILTFSAPSLKQLPDPAALRHPGAGPQRLDGGVCAWPNPFHMACQPTRSKSQQPSEEQLDRSILFLARWVSWWLIPLPCI